MIQILIDVVLIYTSRTALRIRHTRKTAAFVRLAMIRIMLRRLAVPPSIGIQTSRMGSLSLETIASLSDHNLVSLPDMAT